MRYPVTITFDLFDLVDNFRRHYGFVNIQQGGQALALHDIPSICIDFFMKRGKLFSLHIKCLSNVLQKPRLKASKQR